MRATAIQGIVQRLLIHEAAENRGQAAFPVAAERVLDKMRAHLSKRIGQEGFRTLLARALTLTSALFPHLSAVRVAADGSLLGLRGAADTQEKSLAVEGVAALVAHLIALLMTFIGEDITLRMLSAVWPALALGDATDREKP